MKIQHIFEGKNYILRNILKRCSRLETQSHIEWKNKTKNAKKFHYEQVEAGQLADMWGISMPMGIQNLLENIIQHLPQSNYAIFKNEIVTHFEIESSMLTEFYSIWNWVRNFF